MASPPAPAVAPSGDGPLFTPQEEAFLRAYAERQSRLDALRMAGLLSGQASLADEQAALHRAGELVARTERLSLSALASAIGADKLSMLAHLWAVCTSPKYHEAIKGLQLLARIHGVWDKDTSRQPQVALIFTAAKPAEGSTPPATLPFTLPSGDYRIFSEPDPENVSPIEP